MNAPLYRLLVIGDESALVLPALAGGDDRKAAIDLSRVATIAEARSRLETGVYDTILVNLATSQAVAALPEEWHALASASPVLLYNPAAADARGGAATAARALPLVASANHAVPAEGRRHFGQLLEAVPDALIVTNQDNEVAFVNRAAHELFGKARDDFIGERVSFAVREGEISEIEVYRGKDVRRCELRVSRCEWEGSPAQLLLIQDVTEQKRLNEELRQSQKMEAVGVLAGGIAHDFNNLLVVMMVYAEMLREECQGDDPRLPDVMELIKAVDRGRDLTRQLLAFSRKQPATPTVLDLGATLSDLQKMFSRLLPSNIDIVTDVAQSWPVIADRVQVEQLIMNLALNARDAMPSGGRLTIAVANRIIQRSDEGVEPGDYVMMTVTDTGIGIPPDDLEHIFDPFFTTKVRGSGTGLGLATCYGIVKQAGGSIAVTSAIGEGTRFVVLLPRANETIKTEAAPAPAVRAARGGERILLVEDNSLAQRATSSMLQRAGYSVQSMANGEEALRFLRQYADAVDLVLSDVVMPQLSGPELARQLAVSHPDLLILFMTGYSNDPIVAAGGEHRIDGRPTIMKPFKRDELLAFIGDAIERKRSAEAG
ncbi:ATP-binding protein [Bradyrhizobium sp. STM 3809]|uniref:hybrid sensor histidine kinase/response regulator n=1 Tax=Bradyrhizobium sp. STM 3809 TaxID=551936 RepID=UPI000240883C|nr:ATP-binding protein [Bradyrhizobium sp. STM 3809]CCE00103.1 putative histidinase kinase-response regulator hybrid protein [Bradyrhizobium sp. STM 3809]